MIILHACVWWSGVGIRVCKSVHSLLFILHTYTYTMSLSICTPYLHTP
jgi:hypothetical protein